VEEEMPEIIEYETEDDAAFVDSVSISSVSIS
jgi:hypothetical protein